MIKNIRPVAEASLHAAVIIACQSCDFMLIILKTSNIPVPVYFYRSVYIHVLE